MTPKSEHGYEELYLPGRGLSRNEIERRLEDAGYRRGRDYNVISSTHPELPSKFHLIEYIHGKLKEVAEQMAQRLHLNVIPRGSLDERMGGGELEPATFATA